VHKEIRRRIAGNILQPVQFVINLIITVSNIVPLDKTVEMIKNFVVIIFSLLPFQGTIIKARKTDQLPPCRRQMGEEV